MQRLIDHIVLDLLRLCALGFIGSASVSLYCCFFCVCWLPLRKCLQLFFFNWSPNSGPTGLVLCILVIASYSWKFNFECTCDGDWRRRSDLIGVRRFYYVFEFFFCNAIIQRNFEHVFRSLALIVKCLNK